MFIVENNSSIAKIDIGKTSLRVGALLTVEECDAVLIIKNIASRFAICTILKGARLIRCGMAVKILKDQFSVPFDSSKIGKILDPLLETIYSFRGAKKTNHEPEIKYRHDVSCNSCFDDLGYISGEIETEATGIKAIDFFCPYVPGGKTGIVGGAGTGKSTVILELIYQLKQKSIFTIFAGVGERIREGYELFQEMVQTGIIDPDKPEKSDLVTIYGNMDQTAVIREHAAITSFSLAEIIMNLEKRNVLLVVDNIYRFVQAQNEISSMVGEMPSEMGYHPDIYSKVSSLQEKIYKRVFKDSFKAYSTTSIQAIYVPEDDFSDVAVRSCTRHMQTTITLNRLLAAEGIYPCIDPMLSFSSSLSPSIVGEKHMSAYKEVKKLLNRYNVVKNVVNFTGEEGLTDSDRKIYERGKKIYMFITQPFFIASSFTGLTGKFVPLEKTIEGFIGICQGSFDDIEASELYMQGSIS